MEERFVKQIELLLRIAPEISKIEEFALHGGTAINLFHHNMPRLSVDMDLTYIPFESRDKDLNNITLLLKKLSERLQKTIPGIKINSILTDKNEEKLFCRLNNNEIKIEVNTINRGITGKAKRHLLCQAAQEKFNAFFEMQLVPVHQLFGGKIVAALDRQHPRDVFDTMQMLNNTGLTDQIMMGFLFCLFSSKRPLSEILQPNLLDQSKIIESHFNGMTDIPFSIKVFESERDRLIKAVKSMISNDHRAMILSFSKGEPEWLYEDWSKFPGIAWKLKNMEILKKKNQKKFITQINDLEKILK